MNQKELDLEINKIHEEGDEMYIPNSVIEELFGRMINKEIKKDNEKTKREC